jgi:hypothetical protein
MSDITDFISALEAAQSKAKFTPEVQNAASGIDAAALKAAVEAALAMGDSDKLSDDAQITALKKGLDFAGKLVMMLKTAPGPFEKKDLWVYFKIGNNVIPDKPGMFDMVVCFTLVLTSIVGSYGSLIWCSSYRRSSSTASGRRSSTSATRRLRLSTSRRSTSSLASTVFATSKGLCLFESEIHGRAWDMARTELL